MLAQNKLGYKSDTWGELSSTLCLVHCVITPFLFIVQAGAHHSCAASPGWWSAIDYIFLAIALLAVYHSAKNTQLNWMPLALYASWLFLALLIVGEGLHWIHINHAVIYLPAISLIVLHLYNREHSDC